MKVGLRFRVFRISGLITRHNRNRYRNRNRNRFFPLRIYFVIFVPMLCFISSFPCSALFSFPCSALFSFPCSAWERITGRSASDVQFPGFHGSFRCGGNRRGGLHESQDQEVSGVR